MSAPVQDSGKPTSAAQDSKPRDRLPVRQSLRQPEQDQRHPLPGFSVSKLPDYRLIARIPPHRLWAPFQVSPRYAATLGVEGEA